MFIKPQKKIRSGMTIPEMLVSIAVGSMLFVALASFSLFTMRSFAGMANYADLENTSRNALDRMTMDVRQTFGLIANTQNELDFEDAPDHQTLKFIYDGNAQTLTRVRNGNYTKLLDHCTDLRFDLYQRNTSNDTYNQYPITSNAALCKVVQVTWKCQRSLFGSALFNTEVVQTAKIVIRKK
jgi:prepilin-type N-terminal cleavage/methylation domain-containing protein